MYNSVAAAVSKVHIDLVNRKGESRTSTALASRSMQSNQLSSKQIVSIRDALWNLHVDLSLIGNKPVDRPLSIAGEAIVIDLEPA